MGPRFIDISTPIENGMIGFPGDPEVRIERVHALDRGDPYNVSSVAFGTHTGTHVDPPIHFIPGGATIDEIDLDRLNGPCVVAAIPPSVRMIQASDLTGIPREVERVLFQTSNSPRWTTARTFFPDYVALGPSAAEALVARGVRLVGIDAQSIESDPTNQYPVHHRLLGAGVLILEGLRLAGVVPGPYELELLPLRIRGGDGGPARAILRTP